MKNLKIDQGIFFYKDNKNKIKKIIIELDSKTILVVDLGSNINLEKIELKTYINIESNEFFIKNSLYSDGIK